jgi:hypothetical protein
MRVPRISTRSGAVILVCALVPAVAPAQTQPELQQVLKRLDQLEAQNRELMSEIRSLRQELETTRAQPSEPQPLARDLAPAGGQKSPRADEAAAEASVQSLPVQRLEDQMQVQERRTSELDQVKIGTEHRLPMSLTGMLLFNAFLNGEGSGGAEYPTVASTTPQASGGGTMRQSILGLRFGGPQIFAGGKVTGSVYMDFFGGTGLNQALRLRVASLDAAWKDTTVSFAVDKPIIAPREPDSLAQVGVSPLTGSGNLWLWQPQVRVEQRFALGEQAGVRAQFGVYQTAEGGTGLASEYADTLAPSRPGYEERFEFWGQAGSRRIEIAPGFHASSTRVVGMSVPSRIFTTDWLIRPASRIDFTGAFFNGENVGVVGGLRQGVNIYDGTARAVHATGGWAQLLIRLTPRLSFHGFSGQEDDRNRDLENGGVAKNQSYGANLMYLFGSNFLTSFEASQLRTTYLGSGTRINNHYDLGFAYLF